MFYLLNKNTRLQLAVLFLLMSWTAWTIFTDMLPSTGDGYMFFFQPFARMSVFAPVLSEIIVLLIVIVSVIGVIVHFNKQRFVDTQTYMPGIFLLLFLNCGHFLHSFTPAHFTLLFLTLILMMFSPGMAPARLKNRIFMVGLLISVATLIDLSAFGIVLLMIVMIATNSVSPVKDNMIFFSGLLIPYVYAFSVCYISSALPAFVQSWRDVEIFTPVRLFTSLRIIDYVCLAYLVVVIIVFAMHGKNFFDKKLIILRQAFNGVHLQFLSMLLFLFLGCVPFMTATMYLAPSIADYVSITTVQRKYRFVFDILIVVLFVLLWL